VALILQFAAPPTRRIAMVAFARFVPAQLFPFPLANVHLSDFRPRNFVKPPEYSTLSNSAMFSSFNESNRYDCLRLTGRFNQKSRTHRPVEFSNFASQKDKKDHCIDFSLGFEFGEGELVKRQQQTPFSRQFDFDAVSVRVACPTFG